jgi:diguanylate cyclase (GGDEF)-like protein
MELDSRMLLSVAISALLMAVVFHFQARSFPINIKGIQRWSASFGLLSLAMLLAATRDHAPLFVSSWLANGVQQAALVLLYMGMAQFQDRKTYVMLVAVPMVITTVLLGILLAVSAPLWMRVATSSLGNAFMMVSILVLIFRGRAGESKFRFAKLLTGTVFAAIMLIALFRGSWALFFQPAQAPSVLPGTYHILSLLIPSLIVALSTGLALMAFDRLKDELEYLVSHDALTGVYARRGFLDLAKSEISRAVRTQTHTALLMLDLDHFKQVNDRYGHPAGDVVLCKFVETAKTCLRLEDSLGRFGGEEFMVLLPDTNPNAARVVAERIRTAICATRITIAKDIIRFTVSIGIANGREQDTLDDLLKSADGALYLAKSRGRNRVETGD